MQRRKSRTPLLALCLFAAIALVVFWTRGSGRAPEEKGTREVSRSADGQGRKGHLVPAPKVVRLPGQPVGDLRLEGQVIDTEDQPLAGALVLVHGFDANPPHLVQSADDGSFVVEGLTAGRYQIMARVVVRGLVGGPIERQLTADSAPVIIKLVEGAQVTVEVFESDGGKPLPEAEVTTDQGHNALTDKNGIAIVRGLQGAARLWVRANNFATASTQVTLPEGPGAKEHIKIAMIRGATLVGRVVNESGKPVVGAQVTAQNPLELFDQGHAADGVVTDGLGRFSYDVVPPGKHQYVAIHDDYAPGTSPVVDSDGKKALSVDIVLKPGAEVHGQVVDAAGKPIGGAQVSIQTRSTPVKAQIGSYRQVASDASGRFRLKGLPRQEMALSASTESALSAIVEVDLGEDASREVTLKLDAQASIAGKVVDPRGNPVADMKVVAVPEGAAAPLQAALNGVAQATSDGGGQFTLQPLLAGNYRVSAEPALGQLRGTVPAKSGVRDLVIVLASGATISGDVVLAGGGRPDAFTVSLNQAPGMPFHGEGGFRLEGIAPGTYELTIRGAGFAPKVIAKVGVRDGTDTALGTIAVESGRVVRGRVTDEKGAPVAGATVVLAKTLVGDGGSLTARAMATTDLDAMGVQRVGADASGQFEIRGVAADRMYLAAEHDARGRSAAVLVPAGRGDASYQLMLKPFAGLVGRVTERGRPVPGVRINAAPTDGSRQMASVASDAQGEFRFDHLFPGPTTLTAVDQRLPTGRIASRQVVAGQAGAVELDLGWGDIELLVAVRGQGAAPLSAAQVFVFERTVHANNASQLERAVQETSGGRRMATAFAAEPARIVGIAPGKVTICVVPVSGDLGDPQVAMRLQSSTDSMPVYCKPATVAATPARQTISLTVPVSRLAAK